ncbi:ELWxxDGT repeat protein [Foetidibacter luteolus]|uniref:ELWxxDGT repeat protein n=1 Tax=Foetidibacter luteolus TaxID=2608880 RepID=UPI00129AA467|nr:ELWxxDGT repeat protein [Foetidibacter luteolus]
MKQPLSLSATLLMMFAMFLSTANAQSFHLVKDINTQTNSNPAGLNIILNYQNADQLTRMDGVAYFSADDGIHGSELWRTDGTAQGTRIVRDCWKGKASGNPSLITYCNNKIFFSGDDSLGKALWVSDGTSAGTKAIGRYEDLFPITVVGNEVYFVVSGSKIYRTDGTKQGTVLFYDYRAAHGSFATNFFSAKGKFYFVASHTDPVTGQYLSRVWTTDGTEAGTKVLSYDAYRPEQFNIAPDGQVYFTASTNDKTTRSLFVSDGTPEGTTRVTGTADLDIGYAPITFYAPENLIYFIARANQGSRMALYRYWRNSDMVSIVDSFSLQGGSSDISKIFQAGDSLYIVTSHRDTATDNNYYKFWVVQMAAGATRLIKSSSHISYMSYINGMLYFTASDDAHGEELWKTDGTSSGTTLVKDINPGPLSSMAGQRTSFTPVGNKIVFAATNTSGNELWCTDGTEAGTVLLKDINKSASGDANIFHLTPAGSKMYFAARNAAQDSPQWYSSDGSSEGTVVVPGYSPELFQWYSSAVTKENDIYFTGQQDSTATRGIFTLNTITNNFRFILNSDSIGEYPGRPIDGGDLVYFTTAQRYPGPESLWRTDGTTEGLSRIRQGDNEVGRGDDIAFAGDYLFFQNRDKNFASSIWRTDGTASGTFSIISDSTYPDAYYYNLVPFKNKAFFAGSDSKGKNIFYSNGTISGTKRLAGSYGHPRKLTVAGDYIFFTASNINGDIELWVTDGTSTNIKRVKDIRPGIITSNPQPLIALGNTLFFCANDLYRGVFELWKTDGTYEGTVMVKAELPLSTSYPPANSANSSQVVVAAGKIYLILKNQLWVSDGTDTGTHKVDDPLLNDMSRLTHIAAKGNSLWLIGSSYRYGNELFTGEMSTTPLPLYTFTGNGAFDNPANWLEGQVPPVDILNGMEVRLQPVNGRCILTQPLNIKGGKLTIAKDARLVVPGYLRIQ